MPASTSCQWATISSPACHHRKTIRPYRIKGKPTRPVGKSLTRTLIVWKYLKGEVISPTRGKWSAVLDMALPPRSTSLEVHADSSRYRSRCSRISRMGTDERRSGTSFRASFTETWFLYCFGLYIGSPRTNHFGCLEKKGSLETSPSKMPSLN